LNSYADFNAVRHRKILESQLHCPSQRPFFGEAWIPVINGERSVRNVKEQLRLSLTWPRLHHHWDIKRTGHVDLNQMAHQALKTAMNNLPETRRHWCVKHVARFGPVGKMMHRRKEWATPSCPCCNSSTEDSLHVWLCPADTQREIRAKHLEKLSDWMAACPTDPEINDVIIQRLDEWLAGEPLAEIADIHPDVTAVLRQQDAAGWELPFAGMWLQAWIPLQQTFLSHRNTRKTAKRWLSGIIKHLVDMSWSLWEQRNHALHNQDSTRAQDMADEAVRRHCDMPRGVFPPHL
jgi:hypothetical protein